MRALIVALAVVAITPAPARAQGASCVMTCTDPEHCTSGCGDASSADPGSSGPSAAALEAEIERRERVFQQQLAESQARGVAAAQEAVRRHTDDAIRAAKRGDWKRAVSELEAARLLDPGDANVARNLDDARAKERLDVHARDAARGPIVPSSVQAVEIATRMPTELTPARPDAFAWLGRVRDFAGELTRDSANDVAGGVIEIDTTTPWGLFVRRMSNVKRLARELPDWISDAVGRSMTENDVPDLTARGATMILNDGTTPGRYAQRLVELGSARAVVIEAATQQAEQWATARAERGITWVAEQAGAPPELARRALELGEQNADRILGWIGGGAR